MRTGRGDRSAARALMCRHLPKMLRLARRILAGRGDAEAEDAVQEAFLKVWQHAGEWKPGKAKFATWLFRVVTNQCLDRLRRYKPMKDLDAAADIPDTDPTPGAALEAHEQAAALSLALAALPARQRVALTLCHLEEMSNIEAAETMNISIEALESLLARGRRTLRSRLQQVQD